VHSSLSDRQLAALESKGKEIFDSLCADFEKKVLNLTTRKAQWALQGKLAAVIGQMKKDHRLEHKRVLRMRRALTSRSRAKAGVGRDVLRNK